MCLIWGANNILPFSIFSISICLFRKTDTAHVTEYMKIVPHGPSNQEFDPAIHPVTSPTLYRLSNRGFRRVLNDRLRNEFIQAAFDTHDEVVPFHSYLTASQNGQTYYFTPHLECYVLVSSKLHCENDISNEESFKIKEMKD